MSEFRSINNKWDRDFIYLNGRIVARLDMHYDPTPTFGGGGTSTMGIGEPPPPGTVPFIDVFFFHTDLLGTPLVVTDIYRTVKWRGEYYPFGQLYNEMVSTMNNIRFPGQWHDRATGLYYNWHRYYDPAVGRYTQPDPIGLAGGMNVYSYAQNNPLTHVDAWGLKDWVIVNVSIGGGMYGALEAGKMYLIDPANLNNGYSWSFVSGGVGLGVGLPVAAQIEVGYYDGPMDPAQISPLSLSVSAFATARHGISGQVTGTSFWGSEIGTSVGYAVGAGAGVAGMLTYSWYDGLVHGLDPRIDRAVKKFLKENCR